jgi:acyl-CoA thioester hydrolase
MPPFRHAVRPAFYQADPAGVLFYGRVFELFHQGYAGLIEASGLPYDMHFGMRGYMVPVVHAEVDFKAPIRPGERLSVEVSVLRLGRSSITMGFRLVGPDGDERAKGRETHVAVDADSFTPIPIPDAVREALTPYLLEATG